MSTPSESVTPQPTAPVQPPVKKKATLKQKLMLLAGSMVFCFLLLLLAEAYCRLFTDINFQGNSKELFVDKVFGDTGGNARSFHGVSFGAEVWTDTSGFRIDPSITDRKDLPALLILGDSVGFGVGVDDPRTFAGLLRRKLAGTMTVYNSSVIGYALPEYRNVVRRFLPDHPEIKQVYLAFCVNDVSRRSAAEIDTHLRGAENDAVGTVKELPVIRDLNTFLRSNSKLYLGLKNALTDPSLRYFRYDLDLYTVDDTIFAARMQPMLDIAGEAKKRDIPLTVILDPAEPQLRSSDPAFEVPQKRVGEYLDKHDIRYIDPLKTFRAYPGNRSKLYLSGDSNHFSAAGHQLFFDALWEDFQGEHPAKK